MEKYTVRNGILAVLISGLYEHEDLVSKVTRYLEEHYYDF